jgi:hypothetical protein
MRRICQAAQTSYLEAVRKSFSFTDVSGIGMMILNARGLDFQRQIKVIGCPSLNRTFNET